MDDMEEDSKEKCIKICERWIGLAVTRKDSEKIKKIYSVIDTISGTKSEKYIAEAKEFLAGLKQTNEVKEIRNEIGKETDRGVSLF